MSKSPRFERHCVGGARYSPGTHGGDFICSTGRIFRRHFGALCERGRVRPFGPSQLDQLGPEGCAGAQGEVRPIRIFSPVATRVGSRIIARPRLARGLQVMIPAIPMSVYSLGWKSVMLKAKKCAAIWVRPLGLARCTTGSSLTFGNAPTARDYSQNFKAVVVLRSKIAALSKRSLTESRNRRQLSSVVVSSFKKERVYWRRLTTTDDDFEPAAHESRKPRVSRAHHCD